MSGYIGKLSNMAAKSLIGPDVSMPSMADIAPHFSQTDAIKSNAPQRFRTPGWVRTLADFFTPAPQAAAAGLPFVMQMSGKRRGSATKPALSKDGKSYSEKWPGLERYYASLDSATFQRVFTENRKMMISHVREAAAAMNDMFADYISREVMLLDPLDIDYWEHLDQCIFRPLGLQLVSTRYPFRRVTRGITAKIDDLSCLVEVAKKRMPHLEDDAAFLDLILTFSVSWQVMKWIAIDQDVTLEQLERALAEQPDACSLRRADSDSLFDALPDEGVDYCRDPLGDD